LLIGDPIQGIPQQPDTMQIAFSPSYFTLKNENVKLKVKYGFVLQDPSFYFRIITSYLKMSGMPCYPYKCNTFLFLSMCFLILTAFLMRWYKSSGKSGAKPLALRILRILLPVTNLTCATPCESLNITPVKN
jgi:hypothetical protein